MLFRSQRCIQTRGSGFLPGIGPGGCHLGPLPGYSPIPAVFQIIDQVRVREIFFPVLSRLPDQGKLPGCPLLLQPLFLISIPGCIKPGSGLPCGPGEGLPVCENLQGKSVQIVRA